MKCSYPDCGLHIEGDIEEVLEQGFGYCPKGHMTVLPRSTKLDHRCECGARATNQPRHDWYCSEFKEGEK